MISNGWKLTLPPGFQYNPEAHRYTLDGQLLAGLTRMLEDGGYYPFSEWYTEKSRTRGTAVHKVTELVDRYGADRVEIDPRLEAYAAGYEFFKRAYAFEPIAHETPICSARWRIACTPDVIGYIGPGRRLAVVDVKTWGDSKFRVQRGAELQTAGQKMMLRECGVEVEERYILQLSGKAGRPWKLFPCENPRDEAVLMNLAVLWWDRYEHGLLKNWRPPVIEEAPEVDTEATEEEEPTWV